MINASNGGGVTVAEQFLSTEPRSAVTVTAGVTRLSADASLFNGAASGATLGRHDWRFSGVRNTLDITAGSSAVTLNAGANVTITGGEGQKNIAGNSWNSSVYSAESFDPSVQDFAFSWLVEATTGTIREMAGLDNGPTANNSYTSIEFAIYQVNGTFYSRVYESGSAVVVPTGAVALSVGDRLFVKCVKGDVSYGYIRGGVETVVYVSAKKATTPMFFKGAFNRGNTSSGHSQLGDVQSHTLTQSEGYAITIEGAATDMITADDAALLEAQAGMVMAAGSTYSDLQFTRSTGSQFDNGGTPYPVDYTHGYVVPTGTDAGGV